MKVQSAFLAMTAAFAMISGACSSSHRYIGHGRKLRHRRHDWRRRKLQRDRGERHGWRIFLPEWDCLRRQRGRDLDGQLVLPDAE